LTDPIVPLNTVLSDGTIQTQPQNAGSAYVYGFEIAFQQHFTYLPGLASGLGLSAKLRLHSFAGDLPERAQSEWLPQRHLAQR